MPQVFDRGIDGAGSVTGRHTGRDRQVDDADAVPQAVRVDPLQTAQQVGLVGRAAIVGDLDSNQRGIRRDAQVLLACTLAVDDARHVGAVPVPIGCGAGLIVEVDRDRAAGQVRVAEVEAAVDDRDANTRTGLARPGVGGASVGRIRRQ